MKSDKSIAVLAMVASLILAVGAASAQQLTTNPEEAGIEDSVNLGEFNDTSSSTQATYGGNITNANISGQQTTDQWAGLYGTADGSLVLGTTTGDTESSENVFYEWGDATVSNVFAYSKSDGINWANLSVGNASNVSAAYPDLDTSGADSPADTYNESFTVNIEDQSYEVDAALTNSNASTATFATGILSDVDDESAPADSDQQTPDPIFAGQVITTGSTGAFNGDPADYQMIVPSPQDESATSYSMYVELQ